MRIGIVNVWHDDNRGDCAIAIGTYKTLTAAFPDATIEFWSLSPAGALGSAHRVLRAETGAVVHPAAIPAHQRKTGAGVYAVLTVIRTIRAALGLAFNSINPRTARSLSEMDLIVASGGHYLHSRPGPRWGLRLFRLVHPLLLASRHNIPTVLMGQSLGPFEGRFALALARRVVSRCSAVYVREELSAGVAQRLGANPQRLSVLPDLAFAIDVDRRGLQNTLSEFDLTPRTFWIVTVRECLRSSGRADRSACTDRFLREMAVFIRRAIEEGRAKRIALVPHVVGPTEVEDDRQPTRRLAGLLADRDEVVIVDRDFTPGALAGLYGEAELVVGTRFHSVILAMVAGTPVYSISYFGPKAVGIMKMAELENACIEIEDFTADAVASFLDSVELDGMAVSVANRADRFRSTLNDAMDDLRARVV